MAGLPEKIFKVSETIYNMILDEKINIIIRRIQKASEGDIIGIVKLDNSTWIEVLIQSVVKYNSLDDFLKYNWKKTSPQCESLEISKLYHLSQKDDLDNPMFNGMDPIYAHYFKRI